MGGELFRCLHPESTTHRAPGVHPGGCAVPAAATALRRHCLPRADYTSRQPPRAAAVRAGGGGGVRRRGRRAPGTRAGDHGVRRAEASALTPGGGGGGGGASLERAGPSLREGRKGRGERRREAGRPQAGGQRSAERGPRAHEEARGPWAPGSSECGRAGRSRAGRGAARPGKGCRARAAGLGPRGGLVAGAQGAPRVLASRGEGDGCHDDPGRLGGGVRAGWKGAGGQLSPPHLRAGTAEITRWPPPRGYREPLKTVTQLLGGGREISRSNSPNGCLGRP